MLPAERWIKMRTTQFALYLWNSVAPAKAKMLRLWRIWAQASAKKALENVSRLDTPGNKVLNISQHFWSALSCKHVLHNTCQALLIQFPCPYPKERKALVMINTLTVMINKDRWACEAWLVFVITASVGIQLLLMKGWQGSPIADRGTFMQAPWHGL